MGAYLAADLLTAARLLADERPGGSDTFVSDTEGLIWINRACEALRTELLDIPGGMAWFETATTFPTVAAQHNYSLPADHQQTTQLLVNWGTTDIEELHQFLWAERPELQSWGSWSSGTRKGFRIVGSEIWIYPIPTSVVTVTHVYVPGWTDVAIGESVDLKVTGWHDWVEHEVAIRLKLARDIAVGPLEGRQDRIKERLMSVATDRANREAERIYNAHPEARWPQWYPPRVVD